MQLWIFYIHAYITSYQTNIFCQIVYYDWVAIKNHFYLRSWIDSGFLLCSSKLGVQGLMTKQYWRKQKIQCFTDKKDFNIKLEIKKI